MQARLVAWYIAYWWGFWLQRFCVHVPAGRYTTRSGVKPPEVEFNEATELYRAFHMLLPLLLLLASLVQPCRKRTFYYALYIVNLDPVVKQKKKKLSMLTMLPRQRIRAVLFNPTF